MIGEIEKRTQACAHRGDWRDHRENTIPAIRAALAAQTKYVEIDVRLSSDAEVVVIHDPTLERLWGVAQSVSQMSWEEISNIGEGEVRIPRLAEVLDLFRGSSATLLIDMDAIATAKSAWEVVQLSGVAVAWCGDIRAMGQIRSLDATAEIWMPWNEEQLPTALDLLELQPKYINSYYLNMNAQRIKELHSLGVLVSLWTIDDAASMKWAIEIGADSVTSNNVELLQSVLRDFSSQEESSAPNEIDGCTGISEVTPNL